MGVELLAQSVRNDVKEFKALIVLGYALGHFKVQSVKHGSQGLNFNFSLAGSCMDCMEPERSRM
jgi:hypothetical protein